MTFPLTLNIAGTSVSFLFPGRWFGRQVRERYSAFVSSNRPEYSVAVSFCAGAGRPYRPRAAFSGGRLSAWRGDFDFQLRGGRGALVCARRIQALDSFLRVLYSWLLPRRGGLLLHGACLAVRGEAFVFPGVSGAGKSTLAKLAARSGRAKVLSDELVPVVFEEGRFYAYASPFWGEMRPGREKGRYPLAGIYGLRKAVNNSVAPMSFGETLRLLLRCTLNFSAEAAQGGAILALASRLAAGRRRGRLCFSNKGHAFLDTL